MKNNMMIAIILLCIVGVLFSFTWNTSSAQQGGTEESQLRTLVKLGQESIDLDSSLRTVVKWQGSWAKNGQGTISETVRNFVNNMDLSPIEKLVDSEHTTYRSLTQIEGIDVRLNWQQISEDKSYVIVQLEASSATQLTTLVHLQDKYKQGLKEIGISVEWNASVQGNSKKVESISKSMEKVEAHVKSHMAIQQLDRYVDTTTLSQSYTAPSLDLNLKSGTNRMDLQTAVHQDGVRGGNRITIGFPVITIEY
ncbi:YwmB family TATA-box binding protein [Paenibacillus sp. IHBB 10380]|uniref:YwmB family TATA-box binding protein n=1 Tax=Paenibacillus sp. IHBB 10380 TaxID=1566358 RepID=UPI0005CFE778|nr:YwmB family TATA-box binding protein [Paenibacillus sp. IHBB 10380]AJS60095.1 hypothetical protein UB51_18245 [Paenibacillus sp. IHBB 10380]